MNTKTIQDGFALAISFTGKLGLKVELHFGQDM